MSRPPKTGNLPTIGAFAAELCGKDHAFMPIAVRVVNEGDYNTWLNSAKQKYAIDNDAAHNALAAAATPAIR